MKTDDSNWILEKLSVSEFVSCLGSFRNASAQDILNKPILSLSPALYSVISNRIEESAANTLYCTSSSSITDLPNHRFAPEKEEEFCRTFLDLIEKNDFEYGESSSAETYFTTMKINFPSQIQSWLNSFYLKYFSSKKIISGLLRVLSHFSYSEVTPYAPIIAIASLSHKEAEVRECGIRSFENWGGSESLRILRSLHVPEPWLDKYLRKVVSDLESDFGDA